MDVDTALLEGPGF